MIYAKNLEKILLFFAFLLIALRFVYPGDTVFIADEPAFQARIDQHIADRTFPLTSFRGSSIPIPYGGGAFWFYLPLRLVANDPVIIALYHILFVTLGGILFWRVLKRHFGAESAAWGLLLFASSPILFFFSRHSWDNTLFVPIGAVLLYFLSKISFLEKAKKKEEFFYHAILGLVAAYGLNIHLMFGPIVLALGSVLLFRNFSQHGFRALRAYFLMAVFAICFVGAVLPYLLEAYRISQQEAAVENTKFKDRWGDLRNLWWLFQRTTVFASVWGARIFLDQVRQEFYAFSGGFFTFIFRIDLFGWFVKIAAWSAAARTLFYLWQKDKKPSLLMIFTLFSFFFMLLVFQYLNIPTAPHYFHPMWWFAFWGFTYTISNCSQMIRKILLLACIATVMVNTAFIIQSMRFFHENKGARAFSYSVAIGEQKRAIGDLCRKARLGGHSRINLDISKVYLMAFVFDYLPRHLEGCEELFIDARSGPANAHYRFVHPANSVSKADLILEEVH